MKDIQAKIEALKPWYQTIQLDGGPLIRGHGGCGDPAWPYIERYLEPLHKRRILDLGSNAGIHGIRAALKGARVTGIEAKDEYIKQAEFIKQYFQSYYRQRIRTKTVKGYVQEIARYGLGKFDTVLAISILYHIGKLKAPGEEGKSIERKREYVVGLISGITDHVVVRVRKEKDEQYFRDLFELARFKNTRTDRDSRIFMEFRK